MTIRKFAALLMTEFVFGVTFGYLFAYIYYGA